MLWAMEDWFAPNELFLHSQQIFDCFTCRFHDVSYCFKRLGVRAQAGTVSAHRACTAELVVDFLEIHIVFDSVNHRCG